MKLTAALLRKLETAAKKAYGINSYRGLTASQSVGTWHKLWCLHYYAMVNCTSVASLVCGSCGKALSANLKIWSFHHVGPKTKNLSDLAKYSRARTRAELENVVLVCVGCHADIHPDTSWLSFLDN